MSCTENGAHDEVTNRSKEWAQVSPRISMELSITARPPYWMRNEPSRMTLPSSRAATWYCLAISRTWASLEGETETTARAPRSPKRTDSAGSEEFSMVISAPRWGAACGAPTREDSEAKQDSARATARPPSEMSCADWTA